jgi:transcriptional regulator with XRE-family HTH domain
MRKIGNQIRFYMDRERKTAVRLAEKTGLSEAAISKILAGKSNTDDETLGKIIDALGIDGAEKTELVLMAAYSRSAERFHKEWEWIYRNAFSSNAEKDVLDFIDSKKVDVELLTQCLVMVEKRAEMTGSPDTIEGKAKIAASVYVEMEGIEEKDRTKSTMLKLVVNKH